jgi:signal transduction histidine kinase
LEQNTGSLTAAALVHQLQGRAATVTDFCTQLRSGLEKANLGWLQNRIARIESNAHDMQRIIDAIKTLEGHAEPERSLVDVSALCAVIVERLNERHPMLHRAEIRIQSNIRVFCDPDEVQLLMSNLLENALKFSAHQPRPIIRVTATAEIDGASVHVSDNGIGIAPEDASRMFEPFARCHPGYPGAGVGLAIAARVIERHQGWIRAAGELGGGTTVSFSL